MSKRDGDGEAGGGADGALKSGNPLDGLVGRVAGVRAVMLIDRDGSIVLRGDAGACAAGAADAADAASGVAHQGSAAADAHGVLELNPALIAMVIDQSVKLRLGGCKWIAASYTSSTVVIMNTPLLITAVIASDASQIASILELEHECALVSSELGAMMSV
ncbi:hypothetical protein FVE85_2819 [Porphyridium purpureum]|uniref:Roadblock/LAMTOR2 domain-containing protein n=1 Tax=Porphyridium purpureum TaxID=35688 RepID=A0A5J4YTS1_PORPP|nr:hypothetical protein FVE85_2819 [Porphyridium purpureum]|eukprot:POR7787..scf227_4